MTQLKLVSRFHFLKIYDHIKLREDQDQKLSIIVRYLYYIHDTYTYQSFWFPESSLFLIVVL